MDRIFYFLSPLFVPNTSDRIITQYYTTGITYEKRTNDFWYRSAPVAASMYKGAAAIQSYTQLTSYLNRTLITWLGGPHSQTVFVLYGKNGHSLGVTWYNYSATLYGRSRRYMGLPVMRTGMARAAGAKTMLD